MQPKRIVLAGYQKVATTYAALRTSESEDVKALNLLRQRLPRGSLVLDAGCGSGHPVTRFLSGLFEVVGIDFSMAQNRLAQEIVPEAALVCGDIANLPFSSETFDAVCSYYAIIHVPRDEHRKLLQDVHRVVKNGGFVLLCMGAGDLPTDTSDFHGVEMFWSHYGREANLEMLRHVGFDILWSEIIKDPVYAGSSHLFVLAKAKQA